MEEASQQHVDNGVEDVVAEGLDEEVEDVVVAFVEQEGVVAGDEVADVPQAEDLVVCLQVLHP
jgi:hypothetical protein